MDQEELERRLAKNFRRGLAEKIGRGNLDEAVKDLDSSHPDDPELTQYADPLGPVVQMAGKAIAAMFLDHWYSQLCRRAFDSPLERVLYLAFLVYCEQCGDCVRNHYCDGGQHHEEPPLSGANEQYGICVQHGIGQYRADLFITAYYRVRGADGAEDSQIVRHAVVEVDGHDFHEKTKAQAKHDKQRDRQLQAHGYPVYRFTGSEVYSDPFACAGEVIRALRADWMPCWLEPQQ